MDVHNLNEFFSVNIRTDARSTKIVLTRSIFKEQTFRVTGISDSLYFRKNQPLSRSDGVTARSYCSVQLFLMYVFFSSFLWYFLRIVVWCVTKHDDSPPVRAEKYK